MEAATAPVTALVNVNVSPLRITAAGLMRAAANVTLAAMFFIAAIPSLSAFRTNLAATIWIIGAAIMGVFALIRVPPRAALVNVNGIAASAGALVLPCLMRPEQASAGLLWIGGIALEIVGLLLTQVARIYLGRRFGILPANRGIVTKGPFAIVRHPIYLGWVILATGFAMSYPSARNILLIVGSLPFMFWRIELEEGLLGDDPEYRLYRARTPYRLCPGLI